MASTTRVSPFCFSRERDTQTTTMQLLVSCRQLKLLRSIRQPSKIVPCRAYSSKPPFMRDSFGDVARPCPFVLRRFRQIGKFGACAASSCLEIGCLNVCKNASTTPSEPRNVSGQVSWPRATLAPHRAVPPTPRQLGARRWSKSRADNSTTFCEWSLRRWNRGRRGYTFAVADRSSAELPRRQHNESWSITGRLD